jgi:5-(carboxyamino)imidazole ribonucleotide mutase
MAPNRVSIVMGSDSDWAIMQQAEAILKEFNVDYEVRVLSAHRTPRHMADYAGTARSRDIAVIIAGAGGAAHLPGMLAAHTPVPVIGVPIPTTHLGGMDSLLSIVQMPNGVPVATVAIGKAANAALLAISILAVRDEVLFQGLERYRDAMAESSLAKDRHLSEENKPDAY